MSRYTVLFEPRALRELEEARAWCAEHRGQARAVTMDDELARALDLLEHHPHMGPPAPWSASGELRRVLLQRSRYHLYYRVYVEAYVIRIVSFWHERRRSPRLLG